MSLSSQARCVKRKRPTTPRNSGRTLRWSHRGGTYNVGRNASKRRNRQSDIRDRVAKRSAR